MNCFVGQQAPVDEMAPATVSHVLAESFIVDGFRRHHTECADGVQSAHFGAVERILATVEFDRLTRVAAFEAGKLGFGVRVNCVYPGLVPTEMGQKLAVDMAELGLFASPEAAVGAVIEQTPAGRLGEVADMADAVVFLASEQARFITGIGLPVDGGMGM